MTRGLKSHRKTICLVALVALGVTNLPLGAFADPPPWAPANGWRKHHRNDDEDGPRVIYTQPPAVVVAPPPRVYVVPPPAVVVPPPVVYPVPSELNIVVPLHLR
jgi:hypothetical protein